MASTFSVQWRDNVYLGRQSTSTELEVKIEHVQELLRHQQALEDSLKDLATTVAGTPAAQQVSISLRKAQTSASLQRAHLSQLWGLVPPSMRPADGVVAQKFFGTPELLEEVLNYLAPRQILKAMRVQRSWYDSVIGSVKLKRYLAVSFFHQAHSAEPRAFDWELGSEASSTYSVHNAASYELNKLLIESELTLSSIEYTQLGSRVRDMRFCSPPVHTVTVRTRCEHCRHPYYGYEEVWEIKSHTEHGFTIGDLYDAAHKILNPHKDCDILSTHYSSRPRLVFSAVVKLHTDDPILIDRCERKARIEREREERAAEQTRLWLEQEQLRLEHENFVYDSDDDENQYSDDDESSFDEGGSSDEEESEDEDDLYVDEQDEEWDEAEQFFGGEMGDPYAEQVEVK